MYLSRLTFHTLPGKTQEVEDRLMMLREWVEHVGGASARGDAHALRFIWSACLSVRARSSGPRNARAANRRSYRQ